MLFEEGGKEGGRCSRSGHTLSIRVSLPHSLHPVHPLPYLPVHSVSASSYEQHLGDLLLSPLPACSPLPLSASTFTPSL